MLHARNLDDAAFMEPWPVGEMDICVKEYCDHRIYGVLHAEKLVEHVSPHGNLNVCLSYKFNSTIPDVYCRTK